MTRWLLWARFMSKPRSSRQKFFHLVERAVPALLVAIARIVVEKLLVRHRQQRAVAIAPEQHGDERLALGGRLPGPGEHQFLVGDDLAVNAADVMFFPVGRTHHPAIAAADTRVAFGADRADFAGTHPE